MRLVVVFAFVYVLALGVVLLFTGMPRTLVIAIFIFGCPAIAAAMVASEWRSSGSPWPESW